MTKNYQNHFSKHLNRDMEYCIYGEEGHPVLAFPSQNGRFHDYEDFGMVSVLAPYIESGKIRLICPDSIDGETWSDSQGNGRTRIELHECWFRYIAEELLPSLRHSPDETFIATGCSMGGYHAANFFFRRPDLFDTVLSLSGLYHASFFFGDYRDELTYLNSPLDCLWQMPDDHPYWEMYRARRIILCVGQGAWEENLLESTRRMEHLLRCKEVPAWVDYWGQDVAHDWDWWRKQLAYFMPKILS